MSIPSHFPTPKIKGMEVSEIERFVPTSLSRGVEGKSGLSAAKVVAANLRHSIFAKFNQIVHRILNGEWVTKKTVRESIKSNIHRLSLDLEARQYESRDKLDEKIEVRTWIHTSVDSRL